MPAPDDLSAYGRLNATRLDLMNLRDASDDEGLRHRCTTLIANIDLLKRDPDDKALLAQFAKNTADLERYKAGRR